MLPQDLATARRRLKANNDRLDAGRRAVESFREIDKLWNDEIDLLKANSKEDCKVTMDQHYRNKLRHMQSELDKLDETMPDPLDDPKGFRVARGKIRELSEEMARETDASHAWHAPSKFKVA